MAVRHVKMLWKAWYGNEEVTLDFPQTWDVIVNRMEGHDSPPLTDRDIRAALNNPIGTDPLRERARDKGKAVILFDDLTRPTPVWRILPFVLQQLAEAGMSDDQIHFVAAIGNHTPMLGEHLQKKLGAGIISRFRVYNHNPYEHFVDLGKTSRGTPVLINKDVMNADLKIGIGSIVPHFSTGFSGGAKIVLPGVASIDSTHYNHSQLGRDRQVGDPVGAKLGRVEPNEMRLDMEEVARMVGLDMLIDVLINGRSEIVDLVCGDVVEAHRMGVRRAREIYSTPVVDDCDIVVANAYPIECQPVKTLWPAVNYLREGGSAVMIANSPANDTLHYLFGSFGTEHGGRMWRGRVSSQVPQARKIYVLTENPCQTMLDTLGPREQVIASTSWAEILKDLKAHHDNGTRIAVYPCASLQMPARPM